MHEVRLSLWGVPLGLVGALAPGPGTPRALMGIKYIMQVKHLEQCLAPSRLQVHENRYYYSSQRLCTIRPRVGAASVMQSGFSLGAGIRGEGHFFGLRLSVS